MGSVGGEQQQAAAWGSSAYIYLDFFFSLNSPITIFKCKYVFFLINVLSSLKSL